MDPQASLSHPPVPGAGWGTGGNRCRAVRRLLHTGIPLLDWRGALFPIVPSPYSYNL
jgi:hypothetical protein